jgi:hypothetical protein
LLPVRCGTPSEVTANSVLVVRFHASCWVGDADQETSRCDIRCSNIEIAADPAADTRKTRPADAERV